MPWSSIPAMPTPLPASRVVRRPRLPPSPRRRQPAAESEIFLASTGVIGEPLDATKFSGVLDTLYADASGDFWFEAAKGDHDHRHLPEGRDLARPKSAVLRSRSTASPRAPA